MNYIININATLLDALKKVDELSVKKTKLVFVGDDNGKILGSISDGDCRRALISGKRLDSPVAEIMNRNFTFLRKGEYDIPTIQNIRKLGFKYVPELNEDGTLLFLLMLCSWLVVRENDLDLLLWKLQSLF